jgi:hypothetical protein
VFALKFLCVGVCLDPIAEDRRVSEQVEALERVLSNTNTFWANAYHRGTVVLLLDRTQHTGEAIDGCRKALTTMFSMMLSRNPFPKFFGQLLEIFRTSQHIHRQIELNLIAGANFALAWVQKWLSKLDFNTISQGLPPPQRSKAVPTQVHMDAMLEPARRMITKLLEADGGFFREYHYLNPLMVDLADQLPV